MVSIAGLDKADVLVALFNASRQQGMGVLDRNGAKQMTKNEAEQIIAEYGDRRLSFDYLKGRVLKVDITKDEFDPWGFDRDIGNGEAERAIAAIR